MKNLSAYKLCCFALVLWAVISISRNNKVISTLEHFSYDVEKELIGKKLLKKASSMNTSESRYSKIYYTDTDADYIPLIQRTMDMYMPLLASDFGLSETVYSEEPMRSDLLATVILYSDEEQFSKAICGKGQKLPMGAYYGGILNIMSPKIQSMDMGEVSDPNMSLVNSNEAVTKDRFISAGPMVHELTHYIMDQKIGSGCDTWFAEGVALYYEYKYTGYEWRKDLEEKSRSIRLDKLEKNFRHMDEGLAYRKSFDIVNNVVSKHGEAGLQMIINELSQGKRLRTV